MIVGEQEARTLIKPRPKSSHKGDYGSVLLIGGFYPYGGAIIMAALACVKTGAGLVTVATQSCNIPSLHSQLPEVMAFDSDDYKWLEKSIVQSDVIVIGPGLGVSESSRKILNQTMEKIQSHQSVIIDGSALTLLSEGAFPQTKAKNLVLTPHQKEWERLSGIAVSQQTKENTQTALKSFPKGTILVAKSSHTRIFQDLDEKEIIVGGPYQATGGMGDTLCGMIAGMLAQFKEASPLDKVSVGVYLHSAIAQELSKEAYVVLPTTISDEIPKEMARLSK